VNVDPLSLEQADLHTVGDDQIKIVRVPRVFESPEAIVDGAATHQFAHINPHYPGVRAEVGQSLLPALCQAVSELAAKHLGYARTSWIGQAWYSIVTHQPAQLTPIQRLPHFDGFDPDQLAIMIYLNQTGHGGTGFYRQKSTGFETVTESRFPEYKTHLENGVRQTGLPPARYISDGAPHFDRIADFGAAFNSMIVYPGIALHSGVIDNDLPLPANPQTGRLTINGFFRPG